MNAPKQRSLLVRLFGVGENPLLWSVPLGSVWGTSVRVHVIFVAFFAIRIIQSIQTDNAGLPFQLAGLAGLLALVIAHEAGHVVAARRCGAERDLAVLWPLGGLSGGPQPERARHQLAISLAGPAVNLALAPVLAFALRQATGSWSLVFFDPFEYRDASVAASADGVVAWLLWTLHANNLVLLIANLLIPMPPLDAGSLLDAALRKRMGDTGSLRRTGSVGLIAAGCLAAAGLAWGEPALIGVAIVGAIVSWQERSRAAFLASALADWTPEHGSADSPTGADEEDAPDLDVLLEKISRSGIDSLSPAERRALDRASAARRGN